MAAAAHLALSLAAGALTTLSPCVFPLLPLVVGGAVQKSRLAPLAMGTGMATSFALVGVLVGTLGDRLDIDSSTTRTLGAVLLVLFGAAMLVRGFDERLARWVSPLASSAHAATAGLDGGSLKGALALGALLGLIWSPCSGPLLGSTLTLVATDGGAARGALTLGLFGIGAATPLVAAAYASRAGFGRVRALVLRHVERVKFAFGVLLLLVGLGILSGADRWLEAVVTAALPDAWIGLTTRY